MLLYNTCTDVKISKNTKQKTEVGGATPELLGARRLFQVIHKGNTKHRKETEKTR